MISVTLSNMDDRDSLYRAATREPILSKRSVPRSTDDQLKDAAAPLYPHYRVVQIWQPLNLDEVIDIGPDQGREIKTRAFDPRSGVDLGDAVTTVYWLVSELLDLHDNLLAGLEGREVNGIGAVALLAVGITGLAIWWPGIKTWRRSL